MTQQKNTGEISNYFSLDEQKDADTKNKGRSLESIISSYKFICSTIIWCILYKINLGTQLLQIWCYLKLLLF